VRIVTLGVEALETDALENGVNTNANDTTARIKSLETWLIETPSRTQIKERVLDGILERILSSRKSNAKVQPPHLIVVLQFLRRPLERHAARLQDIRVTGQRQRHA
jgi:hypothetical protein